MPNAKTSSQQGKPRILALGNAGSGKTTQILTLPGKKFMYLFDPNAILSLQGYDVEYEEFLPDKLSLKLTSLSKETQKKLRNPNKNKGAELYNAWEADFEEKVSSGFFDQFDVIGIDSGTTLLDLIMDGVLALNGRGGQWPQQDDYGPQMLTFRNIMRTLTSMDKIIYVTGHVELKQDDLSKRIFLQPLMTGKLKTKVPLLFSETVLFEVASDGKGQVNFLVQTRPDRLAPIVRCSLKEVSFKEDVTIDFSKPVEGQGFGGLLAREGKLNIQSNQ